MFGKIGSAELAVILVIILMIFGPSKLPEIGGALGKSIREFKLFSKEVKKDISLDISLEDKKKEA